MSLGKKFMLINVLGATGLCLLGLIAWTRFNDVETTWADYQHRAVAKAKYTLSLYEEMGYGGAIHNFKNFVLRGAPQYLEQFRVRRDARHQTLMAYRAVGNLDHQEEAALIKLEKMVEEYDRAINKAYDMWSEGKSGQAIDQAVKIDDTPYLAALATLQEGLGNSTTRQTDELSNSMSNGRLNLLGIGLLSIAVILGMGSWLAIAVQRRLRTVVNTIDRIERTGDLSIEVSADGDLECRAAVGVDEQLLEAQLFSAAGLPDTVQQSGSKRILMGDDVDSDTLKHERSTRTLSRSGHGRIRQQTHPG